MPGLARLLIKTALTYLGAALLAGLVMGLWPWLNLDASSTALWHVYLHLFMVGWLTQLIFGVAFWLFPRYTRDRPHGVTWLVAAAYGTLNTGLLLRAVAEPGLLWGNHPIWQGGLAVSALLQWLAALFFVAAIWNRVKTK